MQYSYLIMQYFWVSFATSSFQRTQAERIWLITQDLICSKWGERVTEPVVNKSSHLLPLIITVITLIIFNSAPLIRASLGVQSFMNATFTGYNADIPNDTRSSNYELCSGVGSSWQRKSELYWKRRIIFSLWVLGTCFWLAALFFLWHCAPPCEPWYSRQMVNRTKKTTARGDWYLRKVGYIRPCLHLQTAGDSYWSCC